MLLAIIVAGALWWFVSVRDMVEAEISISIDYINVPSDLVVTGGNVSKVSIRLRAPEALIRPLSKENLRYPVSLEKIKKGITVVPLNWEQLDSKFRAFHIIDIDPTRLTIKADTLVEKIVPVKTEEEQPFMSDSLKVENVRSNPGSVILKGPQTTISEMQYVTVLFRPDPKITGEEQEVTVPVDTPNLVSAVPAHVNVSFTITSGRKTISREYPILLGGSLEEHYEVNPETIQIEAEVPEGLSKNSQYLNQFEVTVVPPVMKKDESRKVKLTFHIPEGFKLLKQSATEATVTKIKD